MPAYELHLGGDVEETTTEVSFTLVVRDGSGKTDLGAPTITVTKPATEAKVRTAIRNALATFEIDDRNPRGRIESLLRRMNQES